MYDVSKLDAWQVAFCRHSQVVKSRFAPKTIGQIQNSGCEMISATVPGNFELDLVQAGKLPKDLYYGTNILETQKLESTHLWYFTTFCLEDREADPVLLFEGIDTVSEIYLDGQLLGTTENMLIPHEFSLAQVCPGNHELVVHIIPASVYYRDLPMQPDSMSQIAYNFDAVNIRKASYMHGWDIMPRCVSAGLWKPVSVQYRSTSRIAEHFIKVKRVTDTGADLEIHVQLHSDVDFVSDLQLQIRGVCGDSVFEAQPHWMNFHNILEVHVENPKLWWPKNYGEPNLYATEITLLKEGVVCDRVTCNVGIRVIELERTSYAGKDGTFHFRVNGKKIFVMGTNWVPTDAFPSRHDDYTLRGLEMVNDLNCNMLRCWGGNVYPSELLYDYCDRNGILVWQDFAMACAIYPSDQRYRDLLSAEAESVIRKYRNHPCLAIWCGDNECDVVYHIYGVARYQEGAGIERLDPNNNYLTRKLLPEVLRRLDGTRPYLPSSPYLDEIVYPFFDDPDAGSKGTPAEYHMWGPRDYFKGDFYYKNSTAHFVSEMGYHGCPSPASLEAFLGKDRLTNYGDNTLCDDPAWLVHAASPEGSTQSPYAYRIPLMTQQVERLFGTAPVGDIQRYALESQISQAEAKKFFIEHFRAEKWYRCGILWWNLIDGWPQISDAVVDWYGTKKLAYHYIKTSQMPFCMVCDEPDGQGNLTLCAANDTQKDVTVSYCVTEGRSGTVVASGSCTVQNNSTLRIVQFPEQAGAYYRICWEGDCAGDNHFIGRIGDGICLEDYVAFMKQSGYYDKLEGFAIGK